MNTPSSRTEMPTVFVVDDEPMVTGSLHALLSMELPVQVRAFNRPADALQQLAQDPPDVVLADVLMPEMSGVRFLEQVRAACPDASLILLTGYADKQSAIDAINRVGLFRYLEKPWDNADLLWVIRQALSQAALQQTLRQTQDALEQAQESARLREDFISTLTHDLRTPLLAAIQTLGFMADGTLGPLADRQGQIVRMLMDSHRHTLQLVNVLLDVYQYESGRRRLIWDDVDLSTLVAAVVAEMDAMAQQRRQSLTLCIPEEELAPVRGDRQELRRVVMNLIANALSYTPEAGDIQVVLTQGPDAVTVTVRDNGRGIPKEDLPSLFQRFSHGTRLHRNSGTGLGLYLCRQIVDAHHGELGVQSSEGVGSQFWFRLPKVLAS